MRPSTRRFPPATAALLILAALGGCDVPRFEGPQIQSPPPGFTLNPDTDQDQRLFPERELVHHDAWVRAQWGDFSGIYINGYAGSATLEDVEAARQRLLDRPPTRSDQVRDFSGVERITVDGRQAFAWTEIIRSEARGREYAAYRAVVPYDEVSYAVEFVSGDPAFKMRPDTMRAIVSSFAVGRTTWNIPLILIAAGVLAFLVARVRARKQERAIRHASMSLPKIEKKEEEDEKEGPTPGSPAGRTPSAPSGGGGRPDPS